MEHTLLLCKFSRRIWYGSPLSIRIDPMKVTSFHSWLENLLICCKIDWNFLSCCVGFCCWQIWRMRCDFVFDGGDILTDVVCDRISFFVSEFVGSLGTHNDVVGCQVVSCDDEVWKKPDEGFVKFNVDGSFAKDLVLWLEIQMGCSLMVLGEGMRLFCFHG